MEPVASHDGKADAVGRARPSRLRLIAAWSRLVLGLAFVGEGGVLYADARTHWSGHGSWVGAAAALAGAMLALSGLCAIFACFRATQPAASDDLPVGPEPSLPLLGAILIYKFRFISEDQLAAALEIQRTEGPPKRLLGGILLDLGALSMGELQQALDYQRSLSGQALRGGRDAEEAALRVGETETFATIES